MYASSRLLTENTAIEDFCNSYIFLGNETNNEKRRIINKIAIEERLINFCDKFPTLSEQRYRDFEYNSQKNRDELRERILKELCELERLDDDDEISLGYGGAKPVKASKEKKVFFLSGLPASGKSSVATKIANHTKSYIIDSDYVKRKLPEYDLNGGAALVHDESTDIIFGHRGLFEYCVANNFNMVIAQVGHDKEELQELVEVFLTKKYSVYVVLVDINHKIAVRRTFERFNKTGRYIPLANISDRYSDYCYRTYTELVKSLGTCLSGYAQIDAKVPDNEPFKIESKKGMPYLDKLLKMN